MSSQNPPFTFVLDRHLERCRARRLAPATLKSYQYFASKYLKPALGHVPVRDLKFQDFESLFDAMADRGLKTSTIGKCRVAASSACKHAEREGWIERNIVPLAQGPKPRRDRIDVPSVEEVNRFLSYVAEVDRDIFDFVRVLAATGMRPGECCGLRTEDLDEMKLTVDRSIDCSEGRASVRFTKTDSVRCVTIDSATAQIIQSRPGPYVFSESTPWRPDLVAKKFRRLAARANVTFTPKSLRHFHATQLLASGRVNIKQVAERLGHSNPGETLRCYAHFMPSQDVVAADVMSDVLGSVPARTS